MDLFEHRREQVLAEQGPLAARMRPRTLDEFIGQERLLGPGRLLRRAIQADRLSSLILYGPPGCGKTTLARIIANSTRAHFTAINAVLAGVADIRKAVNEAQGRLETGGARTILFVDEVHRFNKSQQDALLPHVEDGTLVLIGATTENPYFEVNKTLLSRSRLFQMRPLEAADLEIIMRAALADEERGFGRLAVRADDVALAHLAAVANGDARAALNALELAVETTPPEPGGAIHVGLAVAEESIQRKAVLYDKDGDAHFDTISAFIKSLRGSDADAALYWMARMVYAGEDPRFILRRMLIFASEDVGLADPAALGVVEAAARAFDYVGMPEGRYPLAQACLYLATAPKSNSVMAFFDALAAVEQERTGEVPDHLKDASRDGADLGHGQGYLYPHSYRDHWVAQQYLPDGLMGRAFYEPGDIGYEATVRERVIRQREAQRTAWEEGNRALDRLYDSGAPDSAGLAEAEEAGPGPGSGPANEAAWRARSRGTLGEHLEAVRVRLFEAARLERHHLTLDCHAGTGLIAWEALRRVPEGGVWCLTADGAEAERLENQARERDAMNRPVILAGALAELPRLVSQHEPQGGGGAVAFDRILGRNRLSGEADKAAALSLLAGLLAPGGRLALAESVVRRGEPLLAGLDWRGVDPDLARRAIEAEAAIYADSGDPQVNWDAPDLAEWCRAAGLRVVEQELLVRPVALPLGERELRRWFGEAPGRGKLGAMLGADAPAVRRHLEKSLASSPPVRRMAVAFIAAERP